MLPFIPYGNPPTPFILSLLVNTYAFSLISIFTKHSGFLTSTSNPPPKWWSTYPPTSLEVSIEFNWNFLFALFVSILNVFGLASFTFLKASSFIAVKSLSTSVTIHTSATPKTFLTLSTAASISSALINPLPWSVTNSNCRPASFFSIFSFNLL